MGYGISCKESLQLKKGIVLWLPSSCSYSKGRAYVLGGFVWGTKQTTSDLMDVSEVETSVTSFKISTLSRNLLDVQIKDVGIRVIATLRCTVINLKEP